MHYLTTLPMRIASIFGDELPFKLGLPPNFKGQLLTNVDPFFISAHFGYAVVQQVQLSAITLVKVDLQWTKPDRLVFSYDQPCSLFTRTLLNGTLHHFIKGTGEVHLVQEQFVTLAAGSWKSVLLPQKGGHHSFVDVSWSPRFVEEIVRADHDLYSRVRTINCDGFPETMFGVPFHLSPAMKRSVLDALQLNFGDAIAEKMLRQNLKQFFTAMIAEAVEKYSIRKKMREADWLSVNAAKQLIDADLLEQYSTPEISLKVGLNEYKLKKLFPRIAGKKIDEYRKYQLCINAAKKIVERKDEPLKNFYAEAGYTSLTTFIRGFKKLCCCTPGELRDGTWDLASINAGDNE